MKSRLEPSSKTCISLFSGGGGFDIGCSMAGYQVIFSTDIEPICKETSLLNLNSHSTYFHTSCVSEVSEGLIKEVTGFGRGDIDLLTGGPPCPPFSKSRFYCEDKPRGIMDPLAQLTIGSYLRLVDELRPRSLIFENVFGFVYKPQQEAFHMLLSSLKELGYICDWKVVNSADYGVPQIRERFVLVASSDGQARIPQPTHSRDPSVPGLPLFEVGQHAWVTAADAIGDLDTAMEYNLPGHFAGGQHHELLKQVPPGDNYLYFTEKRGHPSPIFKWRSRYWSFLLKLSPSLPSWTIQARRSNNMGPFHWMNRILTIAEVKRLQSFPDEWELAGSIEQQWRQVGNAVPPLLAKKIALALA